MVFATTSIEVVSSTIPGLSSMGTKSREALVVLLRRHFGTVRSTIVDNRSDLDALVQRRPTVVFLGMKYIPEHPALGVDDVERLWLSDILDANGIICTGSNSAANLLDMHKPLAKQRVREAGLSTARYMVVARGGADHINAQSLRYPLFVKPTSKGGGAGVDSGSFVQNFEQLQAKILSLALQFDADALVEEFLPGREFSVAVLKKLSEPGYYAMPLEIVAPNDISGERFLSSQIKNDDTEQTLPVTDNDLYTRLCDLALDAFRVLGARDYGRIDIRLDSVGTPHFLEANLLPSLLEGYGNFPKAALMNQGLSYEQIILQIIELAFARCAPIPHTAQAVLV